MREQGRPLPQPPARRSWVEYLSSGILALLLAIVVWVMAVYEEDPPRTDVIRAVPIQYVNLGEGLDLVGKAEDRVSVQLHAPASLWSSMTADSVEAKVDLAGLGVGIHNVDVEVRPLEKTAMVVKRTPARVVVQLEEKLTREEVVRTDVADADTVPLGYAIAPARVVPYSVTLSGPRSAVDSVSEVVATVWLRGSKTAVETQVAPVPLNTRGEPVSGVQISPATVSVVLGVTALAEFRDVTVRASITGAPAAGYWVSNISVEPPTLTIEGKPEVVRTMPAVVSTAPIDVTGVSESISKRVPLELPEDVSVYSDDTSGQSVLVHVEVTAITGGKTLQPIVEMRGLRTGLSATISPDTVDVIVSGPMPELLALEPGDVRVVVNLYGLRVGRHMVAPVVLPPEGSSLKVESVSPDAVEATITSASGGG
jgi:YbbR domain-containing protein